MNARQASPASTSTSVQTQGCVMRCTSSYASASDRPETIVVAPVGAYARRPCPQRLLRGARRPPCNQTCLKADAARFTASHALLNWSPRGRVRNNPWGRAVFPAYDEIYEDSSAGGGDVARGDRLPSGGIAGAGGHKPAKGNRRSDGTTYNGATHESQVFKVWL